MNFFNLIIAVVISCSLGHQNSYQVQLPARGQAPIWRQKREMKMVRLSPMPEKLCNVKICKKCDKLLSTNRENIMKKFCKKIFTLKNCCTQILLSDRF